MRRNNSKAANGTAANLGFEAKLWAAADALRNNMDAAEYKHVVLGLIFLKYISDAFEAKHAELETQKAQGADPEDPNEYRAKHVLGRVYEHFLLRFANAEGKSGGQFYTPSHVVRVLVEMLAPYKGRVYDSWLASSSGMFFQSGSLFASMPEPEVTHTPPSAEPTKR